MRSFLWNIKQKIKVKRWTSVVLVCGWNFGVVSTQCCHFISSEVIQFQSLKATIIIPCFCLLVLQSLPGPCIPRFCVFGDGRYLFSERHFTSLQINCQLSILNIKICYVIFRKQIPCLAAFTAFFSSGAFSFICLWNLKLTKQRQSIYPCYDVV